MKDYCIHLFWSEEDESFVADIPDLFPCAAFGDTLEAALAQVLLAQEAWCESASANGLPLPAPVCCRVPKPAAGGCLVSKTDA